MPKRQYLPTFAPQNNNSMEYSPREIEPKWRKWWQDNHTYRTALDTTRPKYYILNMFPYPSGAGLHVGHPLGYIASDIVARYKRLSGFNVLNPMGYDSFGLPAEQYAISTGQHPAITTDENIATFRRQMDNIGFSFDWEREVRTSDPGFYKWTQWIFQQIFEHYYDLDADKALPVAQLVARFEKNGNHGVRAVCDDDTPAFSASEWAAMSEREQQLMLLKYRLTFPEESYVNWCPGLGSVLSNDEIKDGVSERGGFPVERKKMKQWSMRITAYADRLISGLDRVDWPESLKEQQRYWIGRSQGASVRFDIKGHEDHHIEVFTTRVDTIYGVTFMVLAPEHDLVSAITTDAQLEEIQGYIKWASARTDVERMAETKKVTGAFTGAYAINPFNGADIPIYIADYVLAGYGTGAVMAVPSGDQRDWNFAKHFNLPIIPILDAQQDIETQADATKEGRYINSGIINGMNYAEGTARLIQWLEENKIGRGKVQYRLRNAVFSRQRYWGEPVPAYWKDGVPYLIKEEDLPLLLPQIDKYLPTETGEPPLGRAEGWSYNGYDYELSTMPGWAGSSWYFYRYMDPHNEGAFCSKEALDYWQQVDFYIGGSEHAVGHLLYSRFWNLFLYDLGLVPHSEYAARLVNQGMIQGRSSFVYRARESFYEEFLWLKVLSTALADHEPIKIDEPGYEEEFKYDFAFATNDLVIEVTSYKQPEKIERVRRTAAADNKRLLILTTEEIATHINDPDTLSAYIKKALQSRESFLQDMSKQPYDKVFVSYSLIHKYSREALTQLHVPIAHVHDDVLDCDAARQLTMFEGANFKLDNGRVTCSSEVEKMSKSKYNVVNPDEMVERYGADCFRMYEMFLGPIEVGKPWDTKGITGVSGFLRKFWSMFYDDKGQWIVQDNEPGRDELRHLHATIKKITEDIERFSLNTCVSHFMILTNELRALKCSNRATLEPALILLAPFAPHIAEELWHLMGHKTSVCHATWPILDESYLKTDTIMLPVQINGKHRGNVEVGTDDTEEAIKEAVLAQEFVQRNVGTQSIKKFIVVKGRIVNIVVG
jgi:leucyl-tRNA synthetase